MAKLSDKLEFAIVLHLEAQACHADTGAQFSTFSITQLARKLMLAAKRLHTLAEFSCNGFADERDNTENEQATIRVQKRVMALLQPYGIGAHFGGDPRGAVLQLKLPRTKRTNGWGGEGYCVPQ